MSSNEALIFSIDVGATQSAIAILHSRPGINAKEAFVVVPRWRGSHEADTKVPSSILYKGRKAFAFGHEAEDYPEDDGKVVRNFKLILHPPEMRHLTERGPGGGQTPFEIPVLPSGVSIEDAYTDYLKFLIAGAKDFFVGTAESLGTSDAAAWTRLIGSAHFVVSVPNGWHEPQKAVVRAAMKRASPTTGSVFFPSEAETSLHYLLNAPMKVLDLTDGKVIGVCDAGGSTIDFTIYRVVYANTRTFSEISVHCLQKGGLYVSRRARDHIAELLEPRKSHGDAQSHAELIDYAVKLFDTSVKPKFSTKLELGNQVCVFRLFGDPTTDARCSLKRGWLHLKSDRINAAFDSCAGPITAVIADQVMKDGNPTIDDIAVVGGFGESKFLQERLKEALPGISMRISPEPGKKAVAAGGIHWWLNRTAVIKRGARYTYGIIVRQDYDASRHGNRRRVVGADNVEKVDGVFSPTIKMNEVVAVDEYRAFEYRWLYSSLDNMPSQPSVELYCYPDEWPPMYAQDENENLNPGFQLVATLKSDLSSSQLDRLKRLATRHSLTGPADSGTGGLLGRLLSKSWYSVEFKVQMAFGGIDISAFIDFGNGVLGKVQVIPAGC